MLQHTENDTKNVVSDRDLVDRLGEGDGRAFDVLFRRHATTVYAYAFSRLRNRADAEEVAQDTFVILWERRRGVVIGESLIPWLLATARFRTLNAQRTGRRKGTEVLLDADGASDSDATATAVEGALFTEAVDRAVRSLSDVDQKIYSLCVDGDLSYAEAAREIGITHAALRGRLARLRGRLRDEITLLRGK
jgi:RNA polymerase sigma factor (sigma-70 family)